MAVDAGGVAMKGGDYLRHLALSLATRLTMIALRLVRNVLLARLLGPADRGIFALLAALPDMIVAVTSGGLTSAVAFHAARQRGMGPLLAHILVQGCALAGVLTLLVLLAIHSLGSLPEFAERLGPWVWVLLIAVPVVIGKNALLVLHNADGRVGPFNSLRLLESLGPLLLFVALWALFPYAALEAAIGSWLIGLVMVVVVGICWLGRFHRLRPRWQRDEQGALARYGLRSHPEVLFQQVLLRADYLLIGMLLPAAELGYYAMASAAVELLLIVPEAVTTPLMKRLLQQGEGMERLTPLALRLTASVMLLACILMALLGEWLIVTLFGDSYAPASVALLALLPGVFALCYASILRLDLLGKQRPGTLSLITGVAAGVNLLLNLWWIPGWGILGAGLASSLAYVLAATAMLWQFCRLSGVAWWRTLFLLPEDLSMLRSLLRSRQGSTA